MAPRVTRTIREQYADFIRELYRSTGATLVGPPFGRSLHESEYRRVFAVRAQDRADGILVSDEAKNMTNRRAIVELAEKGPAPAIYPFKVYVEDGRLMSYGVDYGDLGRRAADLLLCRPSCRSSHFTLKCGCADLLRTTIFRRKNIVAPTRGYVEFCSASSENTVIDYNGSSFCFLF